MKCETSLLCPTPILYLSAQAAVDAWVQQEWSIVRVRDCVFVSVSLRVRTLKGKYL